MSSLNILKSRVVGLIQPLRGYAGMVDAMYPVPLHLMARSIQIAYQQEHFLMDLKLIKVILYLLQTT